MSERFNHTPENSPPSEVKRVQVRLGERIVTFSSDDTIIRQFTEGNGQFDHCVHIDSERRLHAFTPDPQLMQEFIRLGFLIRHDSAIDDATWGHFYKIEERNHPIDEEHRQLGNE